MGFCCKEFLLFISLGFLSSNIISYVICLLRWEQSVNIEKSDKQFCKFRAQQIGWTQPISFPLLLRKVWYSPMEITLFRLRFNLATQLNQGGEGRNNFCVWIYGLNTQWGITVRYNKSKQLQKRLKLFEFLWCPLASCLGSLSVCVTVMG